MVRVAGAGAAVGSVLDLDPALGSGIHPEGWEAARHLCRAELVRVPSGRGVFPADALGSDLVGWAVGAPRLGRPDDGHQGSSGPDQARGPLLNVPTDDIEHQIDAADVFESVVVEIDESVRAKLERLPAVRGAPGADDIRAGLTCELRHHLRILAELLAEHGV